MTILLVSASPRCEAGWRNAPFRDRCREVTGLLLVLCLIVPARILAEPLPSTGETPIDDLYDQVTEGVVGTAEWLDSFFFDDNYRDEANTTKLRLSLSSFTEDGEGTEFKGKFKLRLRLPRLEDRAML